MHIVYVTTNKITDQIYIGVHKQTVNDPYEFDGYLGSGHWVDDITKETYKKYSPNKLSLEEALLIYGEENFVRETLFHYENEEDAYNAESQLVDINFITYDWNYNLTPGGNIPPNHSGYLWINNSITEHRIIKNSNIPDGYIKGRLPVKESTKEKLRIISLKNGNKPPICSKSNGYWNQKRTDQQSKLLSKINFNRVYEKWSDERKQIHSQKRVGVNNPAYGSKFIWITDGIKNIRWTGSIENIPTNFKYGTSSKNKQYKKHEILICPHCNLSGGSGSMKRWHFDNCKILHDDC